MNFPKLPQLALFYWIVSLCALCCHGKLQRITVTSCANASAAVWVSEQPTQSIRDCLWFSRDPLAAMQTSIGLVQFNTMLKSCAVYRFKDVCHRLNLTTEQQQSLTAGQTCETLFDLGYDVLTANAHFAAAWLGGYGPALENIVCGPGGLRNPVTANNIVWTPSGAQMNGGSSRLLVTDATGFNFASGFSMLVELRKNSAASYCFIELTDCSSFNTVGSHFWEFDIGRLFLKANSVNQIHSTSSMLSSTEFIRVAVSHDRVTYRTKFFIGGTAVSDQAVQTLADPNAIAQGVNCVKIGYRGSNAGVLNGVVKMAAVANTNLTDDVIMRFLSGN